MRTTKADHLLKQFIDGSLGGLGRVALFARGWIESVPGSGVWPRYRLTKLGEERARELGYLKETSDG